MRLLWKIWFVYACIVFLLCMLVYFPLAGLATKLGGRLGCLLSCYLLRSWTLTYCTLTGIFYDVRGRQYLRQDTLGVYVANHNSFLDTPAAYYTLPFPFKPLGKIEMQKAFFFGWFYPLVVIMVDRNSSRSRAQSMISMKECLRKGISMCIFPEGSMNRSDQPLTDFHEGAFYLAIEMQVPVFPVVFTNTRKLLPASMDYVYPGIVGVQFLKPVPTTGMTRSQVPQLKAQVQALMLEQLRQQESLLKSA